MIASFFLTQTDVKCKWLDVCKYMATSYRKISNTIWNIANHLHGTFHAYEYQDVILPLTVLKRLDDALEPTKQKTLDSIGEELVNDEEAQNVVYNNNSMQAVGRWFHKPFENKVFDKYDTDKKLYETLANNRELNEYIEKKMLRYVVDKVLALRDE